MRKEVLSILVVFLFIGCNSQINNKVKIYPAAYELEEYLPLLEDKVIGVVANHTSRIGQSHIVDTLIKLNINIEAIFSPEHGFKGVYEAGETIEDEEYKAQSVQIISLYGRKQKPDSADLGNVELMVFDIQDVGVRFYTYISTLHYVMQACAEFNIPLVVLDRPNPHTSYIDGPILKEKHKSFVGMHPVPVVYGMTIGEYAQMINGEQWLGNNLQCDLRIIRIRDYHRNSWYKYTQQPSPNLPNMQSIYLYPSLCFFEGTVMSIGRGTDFPFQVIGHPDCKGENFSFMPISKPGASLNPKHEDVKCYGLDLRGIPIDSLQNQRKINLEYLDTYYFKMQMGDSFFTEYFELLAGTDSLRSQLISGKSTGEIRESWEKDLEEFNKIRVKYLIYPD